MKGVEFNVPLKRMNIVKVHLNNGELECLNEDVKRTGLSREAYIRTLINGYVPVERPSKDYLHILKLLRITSDNMNQIALLAHRTGIINASEYQAEVQNLKSIIAEIKMEYSKPKKINYGNCKDMES